MSDQDFTQPDGGFVYPDAAPAEPTVADQIFDRLNTLELRSGYEALVDNIPELAEPDAAQAAMQDAREFAQAIGQPHLATHPHIVGMVHNARAGATARQSAPPLTAEDLADQIVGKDNTGGRNALPSWS